MVIGIVQKISLSCNYITDICNVLSSNKSSKSTTYGLWNSQKLHMHFSGNDVHVFEGFCAIQQCPLLGYISIAM